jgi:hypothetical protein
MHEEPKTLDQINEEHAQLIHEAKRREFEARIIRQQADKLVVQANAMGGLGVEAADKPSLLERAKSLFTRK